MTSRGKTDQAFIVLDASVWVSRLVPGDEFHAAVLSWMKRWRDEGSQFVSPTLLLAEVGGAISRRTHSPSLGRRAVKQLENLPGLRLVGMEDRLMSEAARLAAELGLRGADSVYVALARQLDLALMTLDADQSERARKRIAIQNIR